MEKEPRNPRINPNTRRKSISAFLIAHSKAVSEDGLIRITPSLSDANIATKSTNASINRNGDWPQTRILEETSDLELTVIPVNGMLFKLKDTLINKSLVDMLDNVPDTVLNSVNEITNDLNPNQLKVLAKFILRNIEQHKE